MSESSLESSENTIENNKFERYKDNDRKYGDEKKKKLFGFLMMKPDKDIFDFLAYCYDLCHC